MAQHDRRASLVRGPGLTGEETKAAISSPAFGALTAELRRTKANHHDVETLLLACSWLEGCSMTSPRSSTIA
ncbi:hypothetical protein GCM10022288_24900 [Gryllotalpicola kribbensis]|uniref:Uncharacterized protein n=1 Tax=Gryllotalpicola kribbensis TaxID=993084 RepID=A0ABP8AX89_9MICO